jgi:hypothetical protein
MGPWGGFLYGKSHGKLSPNFHEALIYLSRMKKTVIVDVVVVNSVMWAEGWERGERGKSQRVGQLLPDRVPEWMGICHYEQKTGPSSKSGFLIIVARCSITIAYMLCRY